MDVVLVLVAYVLSVVPGIECPSPVDFGSADPRIVTVRGSNPDAVWSTLRVKLKDWSNEDFAPSPSKLLNQGPGVQLLGVQGQENARRTCFVAKRSGHIDHRIAFMFVVRRGKRAGTEMLEIRWLGNTKGSGERTWQGMDSGLSAAVVEALVARIEAP